jgi:predicted ABC-type transport system involved in lysophospholipase L1 biosynthesis ATPase subunit
LLLSLQRREHLTVVLVTHDQSIARVADRQINLLDGRVVETGAVAA